MSQDNPFKWRHFQLGVILLCVRWYLRYPISYRDLEEMMRDRGLAVDHTTLNRWVICYSPEIAQRSRPHLKLTNGPWRVVFQGTCTSRLVTQWLEHFLLQHLQKPSIVIMDNAPIHSKKAIKALLQKHGHVMLPLPPYSPDFNPIEQSFGNLTVPAQRKALTVS